MRPAALVFALFWFASALAAQDEARVVRQLNFKGNRALDDLTLAAAIQTTNSSWFARTPPFRWLGLGEKRRFDETEFRADVYRLILLYRQSGYMDAEVDTVVRRTASDVHVTFRIREGEPIVVDSVALTGVAPVLDERRLLGRLPIAPGDAFDRFRFAAAADSLRAALQNRGYPWARVYQGFEVDRTARRARLALEAEPGPQARVSALAITGVREVDTSVVVRAMTLRPGDLFSQRALYASQRDLYRMDVFRFVNVALLDTVPPEEPLDGAAPVTVGVSVSEGALRRIRAGAGYATLDCFRVQAGWSAHDFLGGARTLDLSARLSKLGVGRPTDFGLERSVCGALRDDFTAVRANYNLTASLHQPWLLSRRNSAVASLFAERRSEFQVFVREGVGGNLALTREIGPRLPLTLSYELGWARTEADDADFCVQFNVCRAEDIAILSARRRAGVLSARLVYDNTNNVLDPTEGSRHSLTLLHSSALVGSDSLSRFNKALAEVALYRPIGRRGALAWRVQGGILVSGRIAGTEAATRFVSPDQRFYAGGANTVRGFPQNELGPLVYVADSVSVSETGDTTFHRVRATPTGGDALFVANAEVRFPFLVYPERLQFALFADVGQVWERGSRTVRTPPLRVTPGLGLRLATPVGPVRLDVAWNPYERQRGPLYVREADSLIVRRQGFRLERGDRLLDRLTFHFSVGQAF